MKCFQQMYYFETAKVRPTREDADSTGYVMAWNGHVWQTTRWSSLHIHEFDNDDIAEYFTHWMQLPKAPSDNDKHAFLE